MPSYCDLCGNRATYILVDQEPVVRACNLTCLKKLGYDKPAARGGNKCNFSGGCDMPGQTNVKDSAGLKYCKPVHLPKGETRVVPLALQCHDQNCNKPSRSDVRDNDGNLYCMPTHVPGGAAARVTPEVAQCSAAGCEKPSQTAVQDAAGRRYCCVPCVPGGAATRVVPLALQCSAVSCVELSQSSVRDAAGNWYCSVPCVPGGAAARVVPPALQCAAVGCTALQQYAVQDDAGRVYCCVPCVPGGAAARVIPPSLLCAAEGCNMLGQYHSRDAAGRPRCSIGCLPAEELAKRMEAVLGRFGRPLRELLLDADAVATLSYSALGAEYMAPHLAPDRSYVFFAKSVDMDTPPQAVFNILLAEFVGSPFGSSAVLTKSDGGLFGVVDVRGFDVRIDIVAISRANNTTGRYKMEGFMQKVHCNQPLGKRLYTTVSPCGARMGPELAQVVAVGSVSRSAMPADTVTKRLSSRFATEAARWMLEVGTPPSAADVLTRTAALNARFPGLLPVVNSGKQTVPEVFSAFLRVEESWHASPAGLAAKAAFAAKPAPAAGPAPLAWDGNLFGHIVLETNWRLDKAQKADLLELAETTVTDSSKPGAFSLLVIKDNSAATEKHAAAVRDGVPVTTKSALLAALASLKRAGKRGREGAE